MFSCVHVHFCNANSIFGIRTNYFILSWLCLLSQCKSSLVTVRSSLSWSQILGKCVIYIISKQNLLDIVHFTFWGPLRAAWFLQCLSALDFCMFSLDLTTFASIYGVGPLWAPISFFGACVAL